MCLFAKISSIQKIFPIFILHIYFIYLVTENFDPNDRACNNNGNIDEVKLKIW